MSGLSLRDQLLQAGLIDEKKAKQAARQPHHQRKDHAPKKPPPPPDPAKIAAQAELQAKIARDQELNRQLKEKADKIAARAQVKQLVEQNRLPKATGDDLYNFVDGKKIRRIPVTPQVREQLIKGQLDIVRHQGRYEVVPSGIAGRIRERDVHAVIARAEQKAVDENDPYKDYVVPDDLMW